MKRLLVAVIAATSTLAATAPATAQDTGGLAISPAVIERTAQRGSVGAITVANRSSRALRVTVAARPWIQGRNGTVRPDTRRRLAGVRVGATSFTLAPGASRAVPASLASRPRSGSVYGALEVVGTPQGTAPTSGVVTRYRLVGVLRLNPAQAQRRLRLRLGAARGTGSGATMRVRNTGNTVSPVTGSVRITGPAGTLRASIAAQRILPGKAVDLRLSRGTLRRGTYRATVTLRQGGRRVATATRRFTVR